MNINNNKFIKLINVFEDSLLVVILTSMIMLAVYQIISRNLFSEGIVWIDPLLRTLVLWVGLAGAVSARAATVTTDKPDYMPGAREMSLHFYVP